MALITSISELEIDSGMDSIPETDSGASKDVTPENLLALEDDFDSEEDETTTERLLALTEMFPDKLRTGAYNAVVACAKGVKGFYSFSRSTAWIIFSTTTVLFAPILFEVERMQMINAQLSQQKQVLLGPANVISGAGGSLGPGMPMIP